MTRHGQRALDEREMELEGGNRWRPLCGQSNGANCGGVMRIRSIVHVNVKSLVEQSQNKNASTLAEHKVPYLDSS
jgi:ADP-ribosylglycohydrolase